MAERVFTDEELRELGQLTVDAVQEAIDQGDKEKAKRLARRMYREFESMHDYYVSWVTSTISWLGRRFGDDVVYESMAKALEPWMREALEVYPKDDLRRAVTMVAMGLKGHLQPLKIEEDDEKITVMMTFCGSGGKFLKRGAYEPPTNFLKFHEPQPMTWNRQDFPAYCAHCWIHNALPIIMGQNPPFVIVPAEKLGEEPCRYIVYKDRSFVPKDVIESAEAAREKMQGPSPASSA